MMTIKKTACQGGPRRRSWSLVSLVSLFPDGDIAPSYCGHRGLAGPEGEGPGLLMDCKEQVVLSAVGEGGLKFEVTGLE